MVASMPGRHGAAATVGVLVAWDPLPVFRRLLALQISARRLGITSF
jgi:hypothetical protein